MTEEEKTTVRHPCEVGSAPPRPSQCQIKKAGTKRIGTKRTITQKAPLGEGIVACKQCGEQFIPKRKGTLFCCDECRHKWWGKNKYKEGTPHTFKYEDKRKNTMYIPWKSFEIKGFWGTGGMQLVALIINLSVHDPDNSCFTCT